MVNLPHAKPYPLEVFRDDLRSICGNFNVQPHDNKQEILGHLSVRQTAGLDIAYVGMDAKEVSRDTSDIRRDPGDYYFMILQQKGRAGIVQNDSGALLAPGDMVIVDAAIPSHFHYTHGYSEQVSVHLPRDEMQHRFGRRISGGISIPKHDMLGLAMRSILAKLMEEEKASESHVREALFSVLGAHLTERQKGQSDINPDRLIVTRSIALMNEHFSNADFSTAALAELMGISLRRLQRAFKLIEETPHHRLQSIRAEHAYQSIMLRDDDNKANISTIAYSSGFNDLSTFYRCFKDRYQVSPGEHSARC